MKNAYNRSGIHPGNPELYQLAKEVLFPVQEVQMCKKREQKDKSKGTQRERRKIMLTYNKKCLQQEWHSSRQSRALPVGKGSAVSSARGSNVTWPFGISSSAS
ncbi:uncharacterized protein [Montipora capricornis]|uniref:uncharacterized protein n=1 Tax=Montipora capricornis TaxID=246305 RepID=UPI0035F18551